MADSSSSAAPARYIVGIDLGTTHTVVSCVDSTAGNAQADPQIFNIEQLVAPGEVAAKPLLPSFRYHPATGEIPDNSVQLPWLKSGLAGELDQVIIGTWAQELGSKVAGRLVASTKSWLSHGQVDRNADILPWDGDPGVSKVSPVLASASYLHYVRQAWDYHHPDEPLENQQLVITVPASFDESARVLTVAAAQQAGLQHFVLLEEPQAVVYDWYARHQQKAAELLQDVKLLLVCDIGGGTTDLSLIHVQMTDGQLNLSRVGVGDHLMLGGDNIDLALARKTERALDGGAGKLNTAQLSQLIQQARKAKESLLAENAQETATITLMGSGSKLIGAAKKCPVTREEVHALVLDGFFPLTAFTEMPAKRASAIVEFGLPYVSDPAVSRHLAEFLHKHQQVALAAQGSADACDAPESGGTASNSPAVSLAMPDAILFNGGVFKSPLIAARLEQVMNHWRLAEAKPVVVLDNPHTDLAVALGAAYYGAARRHNTFKIKGGSARSFFLVLDDRHGHRRGVCLLPKGTEENREIILAKHRFELKLGQPVKFNLATLNADDEFQPGDIEELGADFQFLPPLLAVLDKKDSGRKAVTDQTPEPAKIEVNLVASLTEVGTVELHCISSQVAENRPESNSASERQAHRWQLEFEIRKSTPTVKTTDTGLPVKFKDALNKIDQAFGHKRKEFDPKIIKTLRNDLIKLLGKRELWSTHLLRELFNALLERKKNRTRSEAHERVWFNLAGFCLRPGFGDPLDNWRIEQVWPLYQHGLKFSQANQNWSEWWVFWRRLAGGVNQQQQQKIYKDIAKYINPTVMRNRKLLTELKQRSFEDMLRLVASLEHLPVEKKMETAGWLLKRLEKKSETPTAWWALGRIASRVPFYGSVHNLIPREKIHLWIIQIMKENWKQNQNAAFAAVMLGRKTGDRARDLDDQVLKGIIAALRAAKAPESWSAMLAEVKELNEADSKRVFGEALPLGLQLLSQTGEERDR